MTRPIEGQLALPLGLELTGDQRSAFARCIAEGWQDRAGCAGREGDLWFPDEDEAPDPKARQLCRGCPVLASCRAAGVLGDEYGIWGGATRAERRVLAAQVRYGLPVGMVLDCHYPLPAVTTGHDQDGDEGVAA